ncbi:hypothetical protein [Vibrio coralliilyticus]|uniref:hypothetical protein n=1 Tax=Vibrio coralliilyticus TaxID=190893 RepID=UPI00301E598F
MTALPLSIAQVHAFLALQGHSVRVHHPPTREPNAHLHRFWQAERGESTLVISADVVPLAHSVSRVPSGERWVTVSTIKTRYKRLIPICR